MQQPNFFYFFNERATTEIYTFPLHAAFPIWGGGRAHPPPRADLQGRGRGNPGRLHPPARRRRHAPPGRGATGPRAPRDRKSTRLNSSHLVISYAVFCLNKKK